MNFQQRQGRPPRDYTRVHRLLEGPLTVVLGDGWAARLALRLGLQKPPVVQRHTVLVESDRGPNPLPPSLRIGFASDFHAGPSTHPEVLAAACDLLMAEAPDLILLGGDFVAMHVEDIHLVTPCLARLSAPLGVYTVLGNHDLWADEVPIAAELESIGIRVLKNANVRLAPPWKDISICGLDDPTSACPDAGPTFAGAGPYRIVVMHSPIGLPAIQGQAFDLALCGHTHGGQISLPGGRPILMPPGHLNRRYHAGRFGLAPADGHAGPRTLIVSRGVGCGAVPVRLFAPADVLEVTIEFGPA